MFPEVGLKTALSGLGTPSGMVGWKYAPPIFGENLLFVPHAHPGWSYPRPPMAASPSSGSLGRRSPSTYRHYSTSLCPPPSATLQPFKMLCGACRPSAGTWAHHAPAEPMRAQHAASFQGNGASWTHVAVGSVPAPRFPQAAPAERESRRVRIAVK